MTAHELAGLLIAIWTLIYVLSVVVLATLLRWAWRDRRRSRERP